ncbi:MAG: MiaB/RimO family radical SAM methylthiotransferase [Gemmatimonadetes bacterium]|nr:MiaB/RimO family radical SAM methylthiotransferase [Gemmatimonadota bacterium]
MAQHRDLPGSRVLIGRSAMRVYFHTFGCKANQYDTERMRQESEARGALAVDGWSDADVCVLNTCTVTSAADSAARRLVRRIHRDNPSARLVVAGCSAALHADGYRALAGVAAVVPGPDADAVASAVHVPAAVAAPPLVRLQLRAALDRIDTEPVGAELLRERAGATRGWLKIQDGCDRHCSFCATRLARGPSRSRAPEIVVAEGRALARVHPELVLTGIHIGHYGQELAPRSSLARLIERLLHALPDIRIRLGSVEATEVDALLLDLLATSRGRLAPHLHMPLQSGADPVLKRMRRWHTRDAYRARALEIAERLPALGLGADVITGFPGETDADHEATRALVEELPFTYLHVFPYSPRTGTAAAEMHTLEPVPQRVAGERARGLRELAEGKAAAYRSARVGTEAEVTLEAGATIALTGDYLRVGVGDRVPTAGDRGRLHRGVLRARGGDLYIDLPRPTAPN